MHISTANIDAETNAILHIIYHKQREQTILLLLLLLLLFCFPLTNAHVHRGSARYVD